MISGVIVGILSTVAIPAYVATVDKFHYAEAKVQMSCVKRELEGFRLEKGSFPQDVGRNKVPVGTECFVTRETTLTPYNSTYDYENWDFTKDGEKGCVVTIIFFGKDLEKQSNDTRNLHQQSGFYDDKERKSSSDDLILSLGWQPPGVCG